MNTFYASTTEDWRSWLARNCRSEKEVWLVIHHSGSGTPGPRYNEAIEQALCYGWIDSHARKHDAESSLLRFTPRKPRSTWSLVNRERAATMTEQGLMTEHGQALINLAKATGTWQVVSGADSAFSPLICRNCSTGMNRPAELPQLPAVFQAADPGMDSEGEAAGHQASPDQPDGRARCDHRAGYPLTPALRTRLAPAEHARAPVSLPPSGYLMLPL